MAKDYEGNLTGQQIDALPGKIGSLDSLTTDTKTSAVAAINEVHARTGKVVSHESTESAPTSLTANDSHVWGEMASLDVSCIGTSGEYMVQFDSGTTATTLTYSSALKWADTPSVEASKRYLMCVVNGCATIQGF